MRIHYPSRGLGDTIDKITTATGIKTVVKKIADAAGVEDCGCEARRNALNEAVPYKTQEDNVEPSSTADTGI